MAFSSALARSRWRDTSARTTRTGVDGRDGTGKTTSADLLSIMLAAREAETYRARSSAGSTLIATVPAKTFTNWTRHPRATPTL